MTLENRDMFMFPALATINSTFDQTEIHLPPTSFGTARAHIRRLGREAHTASRTRQSANRNEMAAAPQEVPSKPPAPLTTVLIGDGTEIGSLSGQPQAEVELDPTEVDEISNLEELSVAGHIKGRGISVPALPASWNVSTKNFSKKKYIYGNYENYYKGYRYQSGLSINSRSYTAPGSSCLLVNEDPRLHAIRYEWVVQKRVLDIAWNHGELSLAVGWSPPSYSIFIDSFMDTIARKGVKTMIGVDIDPKLIQRANAQVTQLMFPTRY